MRDEPIRTKVLSVQAIPNVDRGLREKLKLPDGLRSLGLITTDCDDASYAALD